MAKLFQYLLTQVEQNELTQLLANNNALTQRVIELDERLTRENEDDDEWEADTDPEIREAIKSVRKARKELKKWVDRHLTRDRDLYDNEKNRFPCAPLLDLSDEGEAKIELPSYEGEWGDEIDTEPNLLNLLETSEEIERIEYIAKQGHPKLDPQNKKSMRLIMEQCLALYETIKRVAG